MRRALFVALTGILLASPAAAETLHDVNDEDDKHSVQELAHR